MNYAQDRLDRRALLLSILQEEGENDNDGPERRHSHTQYGQICLTIGWNDQAIYHCGAAWYKEPENCHLMADYAQMLELSGYPEQALLTLFAYRMLTSLERVQTYLQSPYGIEHSNGTPESFDASHPSPRTRNWYEQSAAEMTGRHCGCGDPSCGSRSARSILAPVAIHSVIQSLQQYCTDSVAKQYQCQRTGNWVERESIPTAHEILGAASTDSVDRPSLESFLGHRSSAIPKLLQFWKDSTADEEEDAYLSLEPVTQLLCLKLLFLVLPSLAIEAIPHLLSSVQEPDSQYKSHGAYYIFLHSLVLGERIKPARRRQMKYHHVALWDRLWGRSPLEDEHTPTLRSESTNDAFDPRDSLDEINVCNSKQQIQEFIQRLEEFAGDSSRAIEGCPVYLQPFLRPFSTLSNGNHMLLTKPRSLYIVGDSHVLSLAWQFIQIPSIQNCKDENDNLVSPELRVVVPILVTGLKAWHLRCETRFFTHSCFHSMLRRIPKQVQTILISAGEIDCREGMGGPLLQGYTQACHEHIQAAVAAYISSLDQILQLPTNSISQILILPVAPHVQRSKGRVVGRAARRETMRVWNEELRRQVQSYHGKLYLLDYTDQVQVPPSIEKGSDCDDASSFPYVLNPIFNADSTHMNSAFAPILEQAILDCGCDISKL